MAMIEKQELVNLVPIRHDDEVDDVNDDVDDHFYLIFRFIFKVI